MNVIMTKNTECATYQECVKSLPNLPTSQHLHSLTLRRAYLLDRQWKIRHRQELRHGEGGTGIPTQHPLDLFLLPGSQAVNDGRAK